MVRETSKGDGKQVLFGCSGTLVHMARPFDKSQGRLSLDSLPYDMPPGVPRDRVHAVEAASLKTLKDLEFAAEAEKTRMTLNPIPGNTSHSMIAEELSMP